MPHARKLDEGNIEDVASAAASMIKAGGIVIYPTDTVYGIGADATNADATERVRAIKGKEDRSPMSVMVSDLGMVERICDSGIWEDAILRAHLPGPFTFILKARETFACAPEGTLGVRMPDHPFCLALAKATGRPIISTSANRSGEPAPSAFKDIPQGILDKADLAIDGGQIGQGQASTVVDLVRRKLIRRGSGEIDLLDYPL